MTKKELLEQIEDLSDDTPVYIDRGSAYGEWGIKEAVVVVRPIEGRNIIYIEADHATNKA